LDREEKEESESEREPKKAPALISPIFFSIAKEEREEKDLSRVIFK
jgi:hypothetical protein